MSRIGSHLSAAILVVLAALVAWMTPAPPAAAVSGGQSVAIGVPLYDLHHPSSRSTDTAPERGPPVPYTRQSSAAVDRWTDGPSARPNANAIYDYTTYDPGVQFVHVDRGSAETRAAPGTADGQTRVASRSSVAANTAARACSFAGATTVLMADGSRKPIEDVEVGDRVIATDPESREQVAKRVEHVFVHDDTVIDLLVDGEVITTTEDHPFWSVTDQRFERADELEVGEKVLGADGSVITVSGLELGTAREALAYNLSVEGIHTYHVGQRAILVHNTCGVPPPNLSPAGAGRSGAFNQAKRDSGIPTSMSPSRTGPNLDRRGNLQPGRSYEFDMPAPGGGTRTVGIRDDAGGHVYPDGPLQNRGPHFNTEVGGHYDY